MRTTREGLPLIPARPWVEHAACRGTDPELFFPAQGAPVGAAKDVCGRCPVAEPCLDYALTAGESWGVWGGTTEKERRRLKRQRVSAHQHFSRRETLATEARRLRGRGWTAEHIAEHMSVTQRTVYRWLESEAS